MEKWWLEGVHGGKAFAHIDEDGENLHLGEAFAKTAVHHVDDSAARTIFHKNEYLVRAVTHAMPSCVDEVHDVRVTFEDALCDSASSSGVLSREREMRHVP